MKINIGFVISYVGPYGPAKIIYYIIKYLPKTIFNVFLILLTKNEKNDDRIFRELEVNIINLNLTKWEVLLFGKNKLQKIIEEKKIKILHSHCLLSCLMISQIKNCFKISTIHCNIREDFKLAKNIIIAKIMEKLYLNSLKNIDLRICCGKSIKEEIEKYSSLKYEYIQNGIEVSNFETKDSKDKLKKRLNLDLGKKYFISVGRFSKRKQTYFIAKEFNELNLKGYGLILLGSSYGEGIIENKIEQLKNKNIIMPGRVSNVGDYLNASDYFISASLYEGLPNSVLEACSAKLPLFLSDIGPHREILIYSPKAGELFNVNDSINFSEQISKIINKNLIEMKEESYNIVTKYLNAKKMSEEYQKIYKKIYEKR